MRKRRKCETRLASVTKIDIPGGLIMGESFRHRRGEASKVLPIVVHWRSKYFAGVALLAVTALNQARPQQREKSRD
jgi:hypothetical protein